MKTPTTNAPDFLIRPMKPDEQMHVANLIFESTNQWYESRGFGKIFQGTPSDCELFCDVYEDLDPGCCLIAISHQSGSIIGSCFYHPRETHLSLGIMNASPDSGVNGVAKSLLAEIIRIATQANLPVRLVSSCFNLDSFSLYNRSGFAPYAVYQDMILPVPESGITVPKQEGITLRKAVAEDLEAIDALEQRIWQISRVKDWQYFIENARGIWSVSVAEDEGRNLVGVLASVMDPGSNLLGPGVFHEASVAAALIQTELNRFRGMSPVFLIPSQNQELISAMYAMGARNCELHMGQSLGAAPQINGIVMPTFMPETS